MLDYRSWINRAVEYIQRMPALPGNFEISGGAQPPLDAAAVDRLAKQSRLPIPDSLRQFWMTATSGADLRYHWEQIPPLFDQQMQMASVSRFSGIWGGLEILSADDVASGSHDVLSWAEGMRPKYPKDARIWEHSLPLIPVGNGDYVGIYVRDDHLDPPVVYMCHDASGGSDVLCSNLDEFLRGWETLCYIGIDFLVTWRDRDTGRLDVQAHPEKCEALQTLLRGEVRGDLRLPPLILSEQDWLSARNPDRLLEWLEIQGLREDRKLRLYCCACCQRVSGHMGDSGRNAVAVAMRFADGLATEEELTAAKAGLSGGVKDATPADSTADFMKTLGQRIKFSQDEGLMHHVAYDAVRPDWWVSGSITQHLDDPERESERAAHADLVRHIFGNPFRPLPKHTDYDAAIRGLAQRAYDGKAVSAKLRAALLDAGEDELAEHFCSDGHPRGCWALDHLLTR